MRPEDDNPPMRPPDERSVGEVREAVPPSAVPPVSSAPLSRDVASPLASSPDLAMPSRRVRDREEPTKIIRASKLLASAREKRRVREEEGRTLFYYKDAPTVAPPKTDAPGPLRMGLIIVGLGLAGVIAMRALDSDDIVAEPIAESAATMTPTVPIAPEIEPKPSMPPASEASPRKGSLWIKCNVGGAQVELDGQVVGRSPLGTPLDLEPGLHRVRLSKAGYASYKREVLVAADGTTKPLYVKLALSPEQTAAQSPTESTEPSRAPSTAP